MNTILFFLETSCKRIRRSLRLFALLGLTFYASLIPPALAVGDLLYQDGGGDLFRPDLRHGAWEMEWSGPVLDASRRRWLADLLEADACTFGIRVYTDIELRGRSVSATRIPALQGIDEHWGDVFALPEGADAVAMRPGECWLPKDLAASERLRAGDALRVGDVRLTVAGVYDHAYVREILIPLSSAGLLKASETQVQQSITFSSPLDADALRSTFLATVQREGLDMRLQWIRSGEDIGAALRDAGRQETGAWLRILLLCLGFGSINMVLVTFAKFAQERRAYAIRRAIGATTLGVWCMFLSDMVVLAVFANGLLACTLPALLRFFRFDIVGGYYGGILAWVGVISLAIACVSSLAMTCNDARRAPYSLLQAQP